MRRVVYWLAWVLLIADAVWLAPSDLPSGWILAWQLLIFDFPEPTVIALYYGVGVIVFFHAAALLTESPQHKPHPLFALVPALMLGSFILLPYYALRRPTSRAPWKLPTRLLRLILAAELVGLVAYALLAGDAGALWHEITHRQFTHVMAFDFVVLSALLF